jgi:photosystem II stability/assembly factor-like uncharacterized protein
VRPFAPLALALAACAAAALAQDEAADPAASEKPHPAMAAPLAAKRTLISVAWAGNTLVAVGDRGHILTSGDGKEWKQVPAPADVMLNRVRFRDARTGFALGHDATILATRDGGASWSVVHFDAASRPLYDVAFVDEQTLFAVGAYGVFLDSTDGGATWTPRDFEIGTLGQHFNAITALGDGSLLVAGEKGLLMRSTDRGATWTMIDSPYTGSFFGAQPLGPKGVVAYGLRGNIYVAEDITRCRTLKAEGYDPYARETVKDPAKLKALGWRTVPAPTTESLLGGAHGADGAVLIGVNGTVVKLDAAATAASTPIPPNGDTLSDVTFRDGRWIAVGRRGARDLGELASTAAAGAN